MSPFYHLSNYILERAQESNSIPTKRACNQLVVSCAELYLCPLCWLNGIDSYLSLSSLLSSPLTKGYNKCAKTQSDDHCTKETEDNTRGIWFRTTQDLERRNLTLARSRERTSLFTKPRTCKSHGPSWYVPRTCSCFLGGGLHTCWESDWLRRRERDVLVTSQRHYYDLGCDRKRGAKRVPSKS